MVPSVFADVAPWRDWCSAAEGALRLLADHVGWDIWMITQVVEGRQVVVLAEPTDAIRTGMDLPWEHSFCRQMIEGNAPRVATVTAAVPAYASRIAGPVQDVAAYMGVPLVRTDGTLF